MLRRVHGVRRVVSARLSLLPGGERGLTHTVQASRCCLRALHGTVGRLSRSAPSRLPGLPACPAMQQRVDLEGGLSLLL